MKRKISIVEIYSHHTYVETMATMCMTLGYEVTIACTDHIKENLNIFLKKNSETVSCITPNKNEKEIFFLQRIKNHFDSNNFEYIFINTIQGWAILKFFFFLPKTPIILSNGRLSEWFGVSYKLIGFSSFRDFFYHNYSHFFLKKLKNRYSKMIFHTPEAQKFAYANGFNGTSCILPFSLYANTNKPANVEKLKFVVTGLIAEKNRDFLGLLDALSKIKEKYFNLFSITILTKEVKNKYGHKVKIKIEDLKKLGIDIKSYDSWITEEEYFLESSQADLFIGPIKYSNYYENLLL